MRVLSVSPRGADAVDSLLGGTAVGETREEGENCIYNAKRPTLVEEERTLIHGVLINGMCNFNFYFKFSGFKP